jgi:riboflavin biosynthesis pyrimidine reductase
VALIHWHRNAETRYPFGTRSPDPARFEPIGFPPSWPERPWIFGVMVASANGVVAWKRRDEHDDPVRAVLGGDERPERVADRLHMRHLRCYGDVAIGAQTLREQPTLVQTPREPGEPPAPELYRFRVAHGLPYHPRVVIYSLFGRLDPDHPVFNTRGLEPIVVGTSVAEATLTARGVVDKGVEVIAETVAEPEGLRRAHERLFAARGVRYLACEGGETILRALHAAELLDEVFLTVTDAVIDESRHDGVLKIMDVESLGASLIAEGRTSESSRWRFQRWRLNAR